MPLESGNFIYATCRRVGFSTRSFIQNTPRDDWSSATGPAMQVSVEVYCDGALHARHPGWAEVPFLGHVEIVESAFVPSGDPEREYVFVVRCERSAAKPGYFAQEHQLIYEHAATGRPCSVLFDQMPALPPNKRPSPIILLAPKLWLGPDRNTFLIAAGYQERGDAPSPLDVFLFDAAGQLVGGRTFAESHNRGRAIDCRELLAQSVGTETKLYTALGRGGCGSYTFLSLSHDARTATSMVEHSLSPHYYISGDRTAMRDAVLGYGDFASALAASAGASAQALQDQRRN
jgi:hypothetical protein